MTALFNVDPNVALVRGFDRVMLRWNNYGDIGAHQDANMVSFGPNNFSLAGIAIHPESHCDSVRIQSQAGSYIVGNCDVGAPLITEIAGPWTAFHSGADFRDTYQPMGTSGDPAKLPFGQDMGVYGLSLGAVFGGASGSVAPAEAVYPFVLLIAYLRTPTFVPLQRSPLVATGRNAILAADAGVFRTLRVYAIPGRKHVRVVIKSAGVAAGSFDVQLTAACTTVNGYPDEFPLTTAKTLAAPGAQETFDLATPPNVYWLFVKVAWTAGDPSCQWSIIASDWP